VGTNGQDKDDGTLPTWMLDKTLGMAMRGRNVRAVMLEAYGKIKIVSGNGNDFLTRAE